MKQPVTEHYMSAKQECSRAGENVGRKNIFDVYKDSWVLLVSCTSYSFVQVLHTVMNDTMKHDTNLLANLNNKMASLPCAYKN